MKIFTFLKIDMKRFKSLKINVLISKKFQITKHLHKQKIKKLNLKLTFGKLIFLWKYQKINLRIIFNQLKTHIKN